MKCGQALQMGYIHPPRCRLEAGHEGPHRAVDGSTWWTDDQIDRMEQDAQGQ